MEWVHRAINHADRRPAVLHRYMRNKPGGGPGPGKKSKKSPDAPRFLPELAPSRLQWPRARMYTTTPQGAPRWHPTAMALIAERAVKRKLEVIRDAWLQGET